MEESKLAEITRTEHTSNLVPSSNASTDEASPSKPVIEKGTVDEQNLNGSTSAAPAAPSSPTGLKLFLVVMALLLTMFLVCHPIHA